MRWWVSDGLVDCRDDGLVDGQEDSNFDSRVDGWWDGRLDNGVLNGRRLLDNFVGDDDMDGFMDIKRLEMTI